MVLALYLAFQLSRFDLQSEQVAFDYFLTDVFSKAYSHEKGVYFSGYTLDVSSLAAPFPKCNKADQELIDFFYKNSPKQVEKIRIHFRNSDNIKFKRKPREKDYRIDVYRYFTFKDRDYVQITVCLTDDFVDHFIIILEDKKVVTYCKVNEVI